MSATDVHEEVNNKSFEWNLNSDSVVVELGGYKGRWSSEIAKRYNPKLFVFEPQKWAYDQCVEALKDYNANVYNFGLGILDGKFPMGRWGTDGCSFIDNSGDGGQGEIYNINVVLKEVIKLTKVDLMMVNIEGYEYQLIPYMFESGLMNLVDIFVVQFHMSFDITNRSDDCWKLLQDNRKQLWSFGSTLSAWERIK